MSNESLRLYCVRSYNEPPLLHAPCFVFICSSSADFARSLFCATVRSSMISLNLRHAAQRLARASATLQCSGIGSRHSGRGAAWLQQCARPRRDAFKVNGTRLAQLHRSGPRTTSSSPPTTPSSLVQRRFARCPARARPILVCSVKVRVGISKAHLNGQLEGKPIEKAGPTGQ